MKITVYVIVSCCIAFGMSLPSNAQGLRKGTKGPTAKDCISAEKFLKKLLDAKVSYEHDLDCNLKSVVSRKIRYYTLVSVLKKNRAFYKDCFKFLLERENQSKKIILIQFEDYKIYLSNTPKCGLLTYKKCLMLMLYNLDNLREDEVELQCNESILNQF